MKRIYITPDMEMVKIQTGVLLTVSDPVTFDGIDGMDGFGGIDNGENDPG